MKTKAIGMADGEELSPDKEGSFVLRQAMGIIGVVKDCKVPDNTISNVVVPFTVIAEDREAAKEYLCELIDNLFDAYEED